MNVINYAEMVRALVNPASDIVNSMTYTSAHLLHMAVGVSGEAGELLDAVKKAAIYAKLIDRENVIEELGDLEFYMEGLRQGLGITREETIAHNIAKLSKRYASGSYSNQQAQERADKQTKAEFQCPRRDPAMDAVSNYPTIDSWREDGTCSYCGSMNPDKFMELVEQGAEVIPTDKNYKAYIRHGGHGQAKFYFQHLSKEQMAKFVDLYNAGTVKVFGGFFYDAPFFMAAKAS